MVSSKELLAVLCLLDRLTIQEKRDLLNRLCCSQGSEESAAPLFSFPGKAVE